MRSRRALLCAASLLAFTSSSVAQTKPDPSAPPTFQSISNLVVLDVTVLDKKGHPVVSGLTKDDFAITEDKIPQRIFSFETPQAHGGDIQAVDAQGEDRGSDETSPTIFLLDRVNSSFQDFAFIRFSMRKYLEAQPVQLNAPAELMVLNNESLELLQGYTRNKDDLLDALKHLPAEPPLTLIKAEGGYGQTNRTNQSFDALQQIALQNADVQGRKNLVWVGHGPPDGLPSLYIQRERLMISSFRKLELYLHSTINMMLASRITLFVIYPGIAAPQVASPMFDFSQAANNSHANFGDFDPFEIGIDFGVVVNETGGKLYLENDLDREMEDSQQLGSQYYTLSYRPFDMKTDGSFRRIRVTLRDRNLHALTKAGYFALGNTVSFAQPGMRQVASAALGTASQDALHLTVSGVVRHPDANTAEFTVQLKSNVGWRTADHGRSNANAMVAAVSRSARGDILASRTERITLWADTQDPIQLAHLVTGVPLTAAIPRQTSSVHVVVYLGGRVGTVDVDRQAIDAAPASPTLPVSKPGNPERGAVPAGSESVTVQQLEQILASAHGEPDAAIAQQLSWLRLSERFGSTRLSTWQAQLPGPASRQALQALGDASEFLDLPASEIPAKAAPDTAEQSRILAAALHYLIETIHQLPNFFATRATTTFQDEPQTFFSPEYKPLHSVHTSGEKVLYQDGREVLEAGDTKAEQDEAPLTTTGVFGPILGRVLVDGAGTLTWSHWEQGAAGLEAVFHYSVRTNKSHYHVSYCCVPGRKRPSVFNQIPAHEGEIAIDPANGTILRVTLKADFESRGPVVRADVMVEYGPVEIGGKIYICPLRSVSLQTDKMPIAIIANDEGTHRDQLQELLDARETVQTSLNHVVFRDYHLFHAHARMMTGSENKP